MTDPKTTDASAVVAAKTALDLLASYLEGCEEFPYGLILTIGGCLIEHIDVAGDNADPTIKRLYDACGNRMTTRSNDETVDLG